MIFVPSVAIIVPTLQEEMYISKLLRSLQLQDFKDYEIVVVDGGSTDMTRKYAELYGVKVITTSPCVSKQRNAGARATQAKELIFIDADTFLPDCRWLTEFLERVRAVNAKFAWVYFKYDNVPVHAALSLAQQWIFGQPNGCFVYMTRDVFELEQFDEELKSGESVELARRVRSHAPIYLLPMTVITSSRRIIKRGSLDTATEVAKWYACEADDKCDFKTIQ